MISNIYLEFFSFNDYFKGKGKLDRKIGMDLKLNVENATEKEDIIKMSMHSVRNMLNLNSNSVDEIRDFAKKFKINLKDSDLGFDLSFLEMKVLYGLLRAFTMTCYNGNTDCVEIDEAKKKLCTSNEEEDFELFNHYKKISSIPKLKLTSKDLIKLIDSENKERKTNQRIINCLYSMSSKSFTFFYKRLEKDANDNPILKKDGKFSFEKVLSRGSLFSFLMIEKEDKETLFEVILNPMFLDQIDSFFMIIQKDWFQQVKSILNKRKIPKFLFSFLLFISYEFENSRRKNKANDSIKLDWKLLSDILKIPPSQKMKKTYTRNMLKEIYEISKELGYILDYNQSDEGEDEFLLNASKFYDPSIKSLSEKEEEEQQDHQECKVTTSDEEELIKLYHSEILAISPRIVFSSKGFGQYEMVDFLSNFLKSHSVELVKVALKDLLNHNYWGGRLTCYKLFINNFSKAWTEWFTKKGKEIKKDIEKLEVQKILSDTVEENKTSLKKLAKKAQVEVEFSQRECIFIFEDESKSSPINISGVIQNFVEESKKVIDQTKNTIKKNKKQAEKIVEQFNNNKIMNVSIVQTGIRISIKDDLLSFEKVASNWITVKKFSVKDFQKAVSFSAHQMESHYRRTGKKKNAII